MCVECGKRRIVYCLAALTKAEDLALIRIQEELLFICGSTLFPGGEFQDKLVVREGLNCSSPIETTYYAGMYWYSLISSFGICTVRSGPMLLPQDFCRFGCALAYFHVQSFGVV